MTKPLTLLDTSAILTEVIRLGKEHPDEVNPTLPDGSPACVYTYEYPGDEVIGHDIVGQALVNLELPCPGVDESEDLSHLDSSSIRDWFASLGYDLPLAVHDPAVRRIYKIQDATDYGMTWGEAVKIVLANDPPK